MAHLAHTVAAVKFQFICALGSMLTGSTYFLFMGADQLRNVINRSSYELRHVTSDPDFARRSITMLYIAVFIDSICNDFCSHIMMFTVFDGSLRLAEEVVQDRAERARAELRQHDVAMQAMQAGPTSLERSLELMQRERHVRELVVKEVDAATTSSAWAALRSLGTAEATRINQLLYCVRLRAMIMPLRYEVLHSVAPISSKPRQFVPQAFSDPSSGDAYLQYLLGKATAAHEP